MGWWPEWWGGRDGGEKRYTGNTQPKIRANELKILSPSRNANAEDPRSKK
jgi:hypothetical protein